MTYKVRWIEHGGAFDVAPGKSLLEAALAANVLLPSECGFGGCGTCRVRLIEGAIAYDERPMALSDEEEAAGFALACQARVVSDLVISTDQPLVDPEPPTIHRAKVTRISLLGPGVMALELEVPALDIVNFRPGQYMRVLLGNAGSRSFSMASIPANNRVDFHIKQVPGGLFTQQLLSEIKAGHEIDVELPLGGFGYHSEDCRPVIMAATGTGIAPLKSMLESMVAADDLPPVTLYWGVRTVAELYISDELKTLAETIDNFTYVPVLSQPSADWQGRTGYVQQAVSKDFSDLSEYAIYLCGSPNMINDAKAIFSSQGASIRFMYADSFSFHHSHPVPAPVSP